MVSIEAMKQAAVILFLTGLYGLAYSQSYGDYGVRVDVQGNGFAHYTNIYFDDESWDPLNPPTYGWDPCCDALLILGNANQPQIFTEVVAPPEPSNNHRLSINGLPLLFEQTDVPLGFLPGELAPYTFTFSELYSLPQGVTVELEDLSLNVTQDLLSDSTYDTWGAPADDEARFMLHFFPSSVTSARHEMTQGGSIIGVSREQGRLSVTSSNYEKISSVSLYSITGQQVIGSNHNLNGNVRIRIDDVPEGIYFIQVALSSGDVFFEKLKL